MRNRSLSLLFLLLIASNLLLAQGSSKDVVYLKNGSIIKGEIIEQIPNTSIKIRTSDGNVFVFEFKDIEKIAKETNTSASLGDQTQLNKKTLLYLGGGLTFPSGPQAFKDTWKMGFNGGGGIGFSLTPAASLIFSIGYSSFPIDEAKILEEASVPSSVSVSIDGGTASILEFSGNILLLINPTPNVVSPYVVVGVGYFSLSCSDLTVKATSGSSSATVNVRFKDESAFATSFGAGIEIPAGETISIFIEGRYSIAFTEDENTSYIPVKAGVRIGL